MSYTWGTLLSWSCLTIIPSSWCLHSHQHTCGLIHNHSDTRCGHTLAHLQHPSYTSPYPLPKSQVDLAQTLPPRLSAPGPTDWPPLPMTLGTAAFVRRSFQVVPEQAPSPVPAHSTPAPPTSSRAFYHSHLSQIQCPSWPVAIQDTLEHVLVAGRWAGLGAVHKANEIRVKVSG